MPQVWNGHDKGVEGRIASRAENVMDVQQGNQEETTQERMNEEDRVREHADEGGNKWRKVYFGVESIAGTGSNSSSSWARSTWRRWIRYDSSVPKAAERNCAGVWLKMDESRLNDLF